MKIHGFVKSDSYILYLDNTQAILSDKFYFGPRSARIHWKRLPFFVPKYWNHDFGWKFKP